MMRILLAALGVLAMGLVLVILLELRPATIDEETMRPQGLRASVKPEAAPRARDATRRRAEVASILARPLFSPTRRPAAAPASAIAAAPAALPRVAGILVNGQRRSVIFAAKNGGHPTVASEGAEVDGYKVVSIEPGQVEVTGPGGRRVLRPSFDPNPPKHAVAAARSGLPGLPGLPNFAGLPGVPGLPKPGAPAR